ncbi:MAG: PqiC family protein, partial [Candidatus Binataceae bacterium]
MKLQIELMLLFLSCVAIAGCSPLAPKPDYSKFFVLTPIADAPGPTSPIAQAGGLALGIGPIDFPDYLKRLEVVKRQSPNQLDISPVDRWGEPLDKNFERILCENLAQLLNTDHIEKYPWPRRTA